MSELLASLVNGRDESLVPIVDRGLQFGDGLFTTLPAHEGRALCLQSHLSRLRQGAVLLGMSSVDAILAALQEDIAALLAAQGGGAQGGPAQGGAAQGGRVPRRAVLKIILSRGPSGRGYACPQPETPTRIASVFSWPQWPGRPREEGIAARFCRHRLPSHSVLAGIKHLNRLDQVLARRELPAGEAAEGLMLDYRGRVVQGISSNIFLRRRQLWRTPDLRGCGMAGIMRAQILACLRRLRWPVQVGTVLPGDIEQADELFFCNSIIGIWPLRRIGARRFSDFSGVRRLLQELQAVDAIV